MKTRILVGVICVPLLVAAFVFAPDYVTMVIVAGINIIIAMEFVRASGTKKPGAWAASAMVFSAVIPYFVYMRWGGAEPWLIGLMYGLLALGILIFVLGIYSAHSHGRRATLPISQFAILGGFGFPLCVSTLVDLRLYPFCGKYLILVPIISAFVTDAGAYFIGMFFGKRRPFPTISPKKSVEGFAGGIVIGSVAVILYGIFLRSQGFNISYASLSLIGVIGAIVTEFGDLVFSLIKRDRGIKDYGSLLPGHGGMLDRFDSMVFAAPVIWALLLWLKV